LREEETLATDLGQRKYMNAHRRAWSGFPLDKMRRREDGIGKQENEQSSIVLSISLSEKRVELNRLKKINKQNKRS